MPYSGDTVITGGLIQKNGNTWPVADAKDIFYADKNPQDPSEGYISLKDQVNTINTQISEIGEAASPEAIDGRIDSKIEDLDVTDTAVANQFVTVVSQSAGKISVTRTQPSASNISGLTNAINNEINKLNVTDTATANNFVTAVSEANGKVSVSRTQPTIANVSGLSDEISGIKDRLDNLEYVPISISSFSVAIQSTNKDASSFNGSNAENGCTVTSLKMDWSLNKTPVEQKIDSTTIDNSLRTYSQTGLSITKDSTSTVKSRKLTVKDNKTTKDNTKSVNFMNKAYWGVSSDTTYNSDFILNKLTGGGSVLTTTKSRTINSITSGDGQHIYYAIPHDFGTPVFKLGQPGPDDPPTAGGFGDNPVSNIQFTNASGYTSSYDIWMSDYPNLGTVKIVIS